VLNSLLLHYWHNLKGHCFYFRFGLTVSSKEQVMSLPASAAPAGGELLQRLFTLI